MLYSWKAFDTAIKLPEEALYANEFKKYSNLSQLVHKLFFKFDKDWRNYRADTIEETSTSEEIFNGV